MRIPFLNLLFLCTALAAPIHELDRDRRDSVLQQDGFGTHGLVPVLPRAVAVIPKPSISKPIKPVAPADSLPPPRLDTPETPPITRPDDLSTPKDIPENAPTSKDPPARLTGEAACIVKRNGISKRIPCTPAPVLPPVPDTATIKTYMKIDPDTSLFYAGPSGYHYKALAWKQANAPSYKQFGDWWTDESWKQYYVNRRTPWAVEFDKRASVAMAEESSGTVYVMLPSDTKGREWMAGTVWDVYEFPALEQNLKVKKLIRVNPDNDVQEILIDR